MNEKNWGNSLDFLTLLPIPLYKMNMSRRLIFRPTEELCPNFSIVEWQ